MISETIFAQTVLGFLAPVQHLLADASVSEIMINGPAEVYIERRGKLHLSDARFPSAHALESAVKNIAQFVGRHADGQQPVLDARLPDGSRVCAVLPPASRRGICLSIRRFPKERLTIDALMKLGSLNESCRTFLQACVLGKRNIVVAGGTGSGKTSLLNVLSAFIPKDERIVVIEDSSEIQLQQPHAVYLESRPADPKGRGEVTIRDLLRASLRMRPDRIVVGECRGGEAIDLIQAMTSGHGGSLSTVHATYPHDTLGRLETLCLMSNVALPLGALRAQIGSAMNIIVQTTRLNDGTRKISHVAECRGVDGNGQYVLAILYEWMPRGVDAASGRLLGDLVATGERPSFADELVGKAIALPEELQ